MSHYLVFKHIFLLSYPLFVLITNCLQIFCKIHAVDHVFWSYLTALILLIYEVDNYQFMDNIQIELAAARLIEKFAYSLCQMTITSFYTAYL